MGLFNTNSPNVLLDEWRPASIRQYNLASPNKGILMRMLPGAITPANIDLFVSKVVGSPGIGIELYGDAGLLGDAATPIQNFTDSPMGASTTGTVTGWQNQAAGAATFAELSDDVDTTYHRNTAAVPVGSPITETMAGLNLGGPSITARYSNISVTARVASTSIAALVRLFVRIGGVNFYGPYQLLPASGAAVMTNLTSSWAFNPSSGIPWTHTDINNFWNNVNQFGIEIQGPYASTIPAQTFRNAEMFMTHRGDNELRFYSYFNPSSIGTTGPKWVEKALTTAPGGAGTYAAQRYGWIHVFAWRNASSGNYFSVPILKMPSGFQEAPSRLSATGDWRKVYETTLGPSGEILTMTPTVGEMFPALIETTAPAIASTSQPYADLPSLSVFTGSPVNFGQTITTPNPVAAAYAGILMTVGWQNRGVQPDAPLTVELRHGAGMLTGGGTLDSTMTLNPTDLASPGGLQDVLVKFPVALALAISTQYFLRIFTSASSGKGWQFGIMDTRSDVVGTGITTGDVEGATAGGTTDSYVTGGTARTRYDLPVELVAAPTGPASLTVTPVAAL